MNAMTGYNLRREVRTEHRIGSLVQYLHRPRYRQQILDHFAPLWDVSDDTVATLIQAAMRAGKVRYEKGFYEAVR